MIFTSPNYLLTAGVVLFGLLLLGATLMTRGQRPHPLLHKAVWLVAAATALAYAGGGAPFAALLLVTATLTWLAALSIERARARRRGAAAQAALAAGLVANLAALVVMKTAPLFAYSPGLLALGARGGLLGTRVLLPVGLSFLTLHAASFLVDVYQGRAHTHRSGSQAGVYLLLLPQFVAGPVSYHAASAQLARRAVGMSDFAYGVRRFAIGIGKRALIASPCALAANVIFARPVGDLTTSAAWLALACFTVQVYFTFSAYGDMAIGLGRLFGLRLEENFRWPYAAESIHDFWRRWHTGLGAWFRDYAVPPSIRRRGSLASESLVVLLCAMWYGTTWGCVAWGVYHALLLALERADIVRVSRLPRIARHVYLVALVVLGWVLLRTATPLEAASFLKAMAGMNAPAHAHPLPVSFWLWGALACGAIGSAPLARQLRRWSVAIDAATTSAVMMLFATIVFVWRLLTLLLPHDPKRLRAAR